MKQLPKEQVVPATAKVNLAATFAIGIQADLNEPALKKQILAMPTLKTELYSELGNITWAAWYAWTMWQDAAVLKTGVKVPPELLERAATRRSRMLTVLDYHLGEEPNVERALDDIRRGNGYQDTAADLARLGRLYRKHQASISGDPKFYRADDARLADEDAAAIIEALSSAGQGGKEWSDRLARAWTLLIQAYDEVTAAVYWLYRDNPDAAEKYPSLYVIARPNVGRRRQDNASGGQGAGEPAATGEPEPSE